MVLRLALTSPRNVCPASVRLRLRVLRWNSRTPSRASSLATLLPTAAGVRLRRRAASAKLPTSALRTKHSILLKVSITATINFWFTQIIVIRVYTEGNAKSILDANHKASGLALLEIDMTTQQLTGKVALIQ